MLRPGSVCMWKRCRLSASCSITGSVNLRVRTISETMGNSIAATACSDITQELIAPKKKMEVTSRRGWCPHRCSTQSDMRVLRPQAIIAPFTLDPSGDDVIEHDIEIRPVRPSAGSDILSVDIDNSYESAGYLDAYAGTVRYHRAFDEVD